MKGHRTMKQKRQSGRWARKVWWEGQRRGFYFFLFLFCLLALSIFPTVTSASFPHQEAASTTFQQSLEDLGYLTDVVLEGLHVETTFAFPLPEQGITEGELQLEMRASPFLRDDSSVQVYINEQPITGMTIEELRKSPLLVVPVEATTREFLTVRVVGSLSMSNNQCEDENSRNLWLTISRASFLEYSYEATKESIHSFLQTPGGRVIFHGLWETPEERGASISLFSAFNYLYRNSPTRVVLAEQVTETEETIQDRDVFVVMGDNVPVLERDKNALYVLPTPEAINELLAHEGQPLLLANRIFSLDTVPAPSNPNADVPARADRRLDLAELRFGSQDRVGIGSLPVSVRFTRADLGGWPSELSFHLDAAFDPIPLDSLERAFLRVRLNGNVLETFDIRGLSVLQRDIPIPDYLLQVDNALEVTFVYAPESGNCLGSPYGFTGQLRDSSALIWSGYAEARGLFPEVIGIEGDGALYLLDGTESDAQAMALLLGTLNRYSFDPLLPRLADSTTLGQPIDADYRIVLGSSRATTALNLPVNLETRFEILNPQQENEVILLGVPDQPLVALQYVADDIPTLVLQSNPATEDGMLLQMVKRMTDPERFFRLNGDVVVSDGVELIALNLSNSTFRINTPDIQDWRYWLTRYRWVLMIVIIVLLIGLWWSVYNRVGRRPPVPVPPKA